MNNNVVGEWISEVIPFVTAVAGGIGTYFVTKANIKKELTLSRDSQRTEELNLKYDYEKSLRDELRSLIELHKENVIQHKNEVNEYKIKIEEDREFYRSQINEDRVLYRAEIGEARKEIQVLTEHVHKLSDQNIQLIEQVRNLNDQNLNLTYENRVLNNKVDSLIGELQQIKKS